MRPIFSFRALRDRKLVQWSLAYLAGGWLALEVTGFLADTFAWPIAIVRGMVALVGIGFIGALVVAWYHGEQGEQRIGGRELLLLSGVFVAAALGVAVATRAPASVLTAGAAAPAGALAPAPAAVRQVTFSGRALHSALSPDGDYLAFTTLGDSSEYVLVRDLAGGAPDTAFEVTAASGLEWSPDGTRLVVSGFDAATQAGLVAIVPRAGGVVRHLHVARSDRSNIPVARWHPDGRHVGIRTSVFTRILMVDVETEDTVSVAVPGDHRVFTAWDWSDDGGLLAVALVWDPPFRTEIRIVGADGASRLVHRDSVDINWLRWSADDAVIYFSRGHDEIWRVPVAGSGSGVAVPVRERLDALRPEWEMFRFSLTRDARTFSYTSGRRFSNLFLLDPGAVAADPAVTQLTRGTALRSAAAVSPDGRRVAYTESTGEQSEIFLVSTDGGAPRQLTQGARVAYGDLAWSPDGTMVAFSAHRDGRQELWLARVDDGRLLRPGNRVVRTTGMLTWAPGRDILHVAGFHLTRLDPSSGQERGVMPDSGWLWHPEYAPDGRHVALRWLVPPGQTGRAGFWIFDLEDPATSLVIPGFGYWPSGWSDDGRYVYVALYRRSPALYRLDTWQGEAAVPEAFLTTPFRAAECIPAGRYRTGAFLCIAHEFVSDIALIDEFDPR